MHFTGSFRRRLSHSRLVHDGLLTAHRVALILYGFLASDMKTILVPTVRVRPRMTLGMLF